MSTDEDAATDDQAVIREAEELLDEWCASASEAAPRVLHLLRDELKMHPSAAYLALYFIMRNMDDKAVADRGRSHAEVLLPHVHVDPYIENVREDGT